MAARTLTTRSTQHAVYDQVRDALTDTPAQAANLRARADLRQMEERPTGAASHREREVAELRADPELAA